LVVTGVQEASIDSASEWFPTLARRVSVATSQGREWLAGGYDPVVVAHREVESCATTSCIAEWSARTGIEFDHILVVPSPDAPRCCGELTASLAGDPRYRFVHREGDTVLYVRTR
jgi:hypothetical protein